MTTTAPTRKKVLAVKKIQVGTWGEVENLVDPIRQRKPITEKYPDQMLEFWLDDPDEPKLLLMCRVSDAPDRKRRTT